METPNIYIFVEGGLVEEVRSDQPVNVTVIDYDEGAQQGKTRPEWARHMLGRARDAVEDETEVVW